MKQDEKFLKESLKESMHKKKLVKIATQKTIKQNEALAAFFKKNMPDFDRNAKLRQVERKKAEALSTENIDVNMDSHQRLLSDEAYSVQQVQSPKEQQENLNIQVQ